MADRYLIVIDMQNDFVSGVLGSEEARKIEGNVVEKVQNFDGKVIFTKDTHHADYLSTQEGKYLPVGHCIEGSCGWELIDGLDRIQKEKNWPVYCKPTFGSLELAAALAQENQKSPIDSIELIGVCTDICVVSNAFLLKANMPEVPIYVDASCCAGITVEKHEAALETMKSCQILVENF